MSFIESLFTDSCEYMNFTAPNKWVVVSCNNNGALSFPVWFIWLSFFLGFIGGVIVCYYFLKKYVESKND